MPYEHLSEPIDSKKSLKSCDVVIAEVSYPSAGQGIELGWANASGVPILFIFKKHAKLSRSLKIISADFLKYDNHQDLIQKIEDFLSRQSSPKTQPKN